MKNIIKKIKKRIKILINNLKADLYFSTEYAILRVIDDIGGCFQLNQISDKAHRRKDEWILNYLEKNLEHIIKKYEECTNKGLLNKNVNIWVCWWSGEENAPEIVKKSIKSIKNNAGNHQVKVIDQNTYLDYIEIPDYIMKKVRNGKMGLAHLSDYIRVSLLEKYGGIWLDATIFCKEMLPDEYFEMPFFTCKSDFTECKYISKMRWTTFVLGGWQGNIFFQFIKECFEEYWMKEEVAIDYLFFDYLIELGYRKIPEISEQIEKVPNNNLHRDDLQAAMNMALPADQWENVLKDDTILYKLSWRETYSHITEDESPSIFSYYLNMEI